MPVWPAFSDSNPEVMYFGPTPHTGPVPSAESLKVLDAYYAATGNQEFKKRMEYMITELKEWEVGYAGGFPNSNKL